MPAFAFLLDGGPPKAALVLHWISCIAMPIAIAFFSWLAIRRSRKLFPTLLALCVVGAAVILLPAYDLIHWGYPFYPSLGFTIIPWIGAALPLTAVILFYFRVTPGVESGRKGNQRWARSAQLTSMVGIGWLALRYRWIAITPEMGFVLAWVLVVGSVCYVAIFSMRRFRTLK
jgi:hypothetical protein